MQLRMVQRGYNVQTLMATDLIMSPRRLLYGGCDPLVA